MKYPFAVMTALGILACGISPAHANNRAVETELANQSNLSMFYEALINTGVANELNEDTQYAIFAPTNAAFAEIEPRAYPCFYATQCRSAVADILRNHIVPKNINIHRFTERGAGIRTLGNRMLNLEEAYIGDYTADGHKILTEDLGNRASVYQIDGVIATDRELAFFRTQPTQPMANMPPAAGQGTTVTYGAQVLSPGYAGGYYMTPNGPVSAPAGYARPVQGGVNQDTVTTTTETQTTTNR